jgi:hypothetical protein
LDVPEKALTYSSKGTYMCWDYLSVAAYSSLLLLMRKELPLIGKFLGLHPAASGAQKDTYG